MKSLWAMLGCCSIAFAVGCGETPKPSNTTTPPPVTPMDPNYQKMMQTVPSTGSTPPAGDTATNAPADGSTPAKTGDAPKEGDKPEEGAAKEGAADATKDENK